MHEKMMTTVLIIGAPQGSDSPALQISSISLFETQILIAHNIKEAVKMLLEKPIDIVLMEFTVNDGDALGFLEAMGYLMVRILPIIVLAQPQEEKWGLNAFRKGARDFIVKDKSGHYLQRLHLIVEKIVQEEMLYRSSVQLQKNSDQILSCLTLPIVIWDVNNIIQFANTSASLYFEQPEWTGKSIEVVCDKLGPHFPVLLQGALEKLQISNQKIEIHESNIKATVLVMLDELFHKSGYVLLVHRDVS